MAFGQTLGGLKTLLAEAGHVDACAFDTRARIDDILVVTSRCCPTVSAMQEVSHPRNPQGERCRTITTGGGAPAAAA